MRCCGAIEFCGELGLLGVSQSSGLGRLLLLAIPANSLLPVPMGPVTVEAVDDVPARCSGDSALTTRPAPTATPTPVGPSELFILDPVGPASLEAGASTTAPTTPDASS